MRLIVTVGEVSLDARVPADDPVDAWMPDLLAVLRDNDVLPPRAETGPSGLRRDGVTWFRRGGDRLDPTRSLAAQGIADGTRLWWGSSPGGPVQVLDAIDAAPPVRSSGAAPILSACAHALLAGVQVAGLLGVVAVPIERTLGISLPAAFGLTPGPVAVEISAGLFAVQLALVVVLGIRLHPDDRHARAAWIVAGGAGAIAAITGGIAIAGRSGISWPLTVAAPVIVLAIILAAFTNRHGGLGVGLLAAGALLGAAGGLMAVPTLTQDTAFAAAMLIAIVAASASHRFAAALTDNPANADIDPREAERIDVPGLAGVVAEVVDRPRRRLMRARGLQSAVLAACAAFVVLAGLLNEHDALSVAYDVMCLFAIVRLLLLAAYPGRQYLTPVIVAAACYLVAVTFPSTAAGVGGVALAVAAAASLPRRSARARRFGDVVLARSRVPALLGVFGLFIAEIDGWALAWNAGSQVGRLLT